jgi:3-deoxy-7-phosphoheptulonate synthase
MLWVGDRTRDISVAHINCLVWLANPIFLKVGPTLSTDEILKLKDTLNSENEKGRLTLITRLGHNSISKMLPK